MESIKSTPEPRFNVSNFYLAMIYQPHDSVAPDHRMILQVMALDVLGHTVSLLVCFPSFEIP